jgi:ArsR family transcriptional regulator
MTMSGSTRERYRLRSEFLKALAHPARLLMVDALAAGPRCVGELTELVGADASTVSRHLSLLKAAGILADEKRGAQVFYHLRVCCLGDFLACIERAVRDVDQSRRAAVG